MTLGGFFLEKKQSLIVILAVLFDLVDYLGGFIPFLGDALDVLYVLLSVMIILAFDRNLRHSGPPLFIYIMIELVLGIITLGVADFIPSGIIGLIVRNQIEKKEGEPF